MRAARTGIGRGILVWFRPAMTRRRLPLLVLAVLAAGPATGCGEQDVKLDKGANQRVRESLSKQTSSSTGSSESEVIALVVRPAWPLAPLAVTTATPVGNEPIASRKRRAVITRRRPYPLPPVWKTTARDTQCDRLTGRRRAL